MARRRDNSTPAGRDYRGRHRRNTGLPPHRPRPGRGGRAFGWAVGLVVALFLFAPLGDPINGFVTPHVGCRIVTVMDGDTVKMICPRSGWRTGRILGFDTPETQGRCLRETGLALAATYYLRWILWTGGHIEARTEGVDRYGRALTLLMVDGEGVARRMVEAGLARWYEGGRRASWCD